MCGIVGNSGQFERAALTAANRLQAHRGPDDSEVWVEAAAGVGLAQVRLSILDLSPLGHQPMLAEDGVIALVFNGEIYNFRELRAELMRAGVVFRGHADTGVLQWVYWAEGVPYLRVAV